MSGPQPQLMSVSEFATAIGKAERQVYRYVKRGQVSVLTEEVNGRTVVRIPNSELERFRQGAVLTGPDSEGAMSGPGQDTSGPHRDQPDTLEEEDMDGALAPGYVPLERHESVVMRLGWLEAQLEISRRMLGDGGAKEAELRQREEDLRHQLQTEVQARHQAEVEAAEARARSEALARQLQEAEERLVRPWWKKMFAAG